MKVQNVFLLVVLFFSVSSFYSCTTDVNVEPDNYDYDVLVDGPLLVSQKCRYRVTSAQADTNQTLPAGVVVGGYVCTPCVTHSNCPGTLVNHVLQNPRGVTIGWVSGDLAHSPTKCSGCAQGVHIN